jgi:LmbE family N-acetylglucosaminyl deacetylase
MRVLAIGAHPDDIELGCGGTLAAHRDAGHSVAMLVMTIGERGPQLRCTRMTEQRDASDVLGAELYWGGLPDCDVDAGSRTVAVIEDVLAEVRPDIVYTHAPEDSHQDHRAVSLASMSACRRLSRLCFYEGPTTLSFDPVVFVDVSATMPAKLASLRAHVSQVLKNGLVDLEAIEALARHRGFQGRIRQAEAFATQRFVWSVSGADGQAAQLRSSASFGAGENKQPAYAGRTNSSAVWASDRT